MTFGDRLRDALAREGAAVPSRSGDFDRVVQRGKRRKVTAYAMMALVGAVVVFGSVGIAAALLAGDDAQVVADRTVPPLTGATVPFAVTTTMPSAATTAAPVATAVPATTVATPTIITTLPPGGPGCNLLGVGSAGENQLVEELDAWLRETRPELAASGGRVAPSGRVSASAGWAVVPAQFTRVIFEPTMFVRTPSGDWSEAWTGPADAAELIRTQVADTIAELPTELLDCADLSAFLEPSQATALSADLIERAALGRDIAAGGGFVWVSTDLIFEPGVETAEVLQIDASTGLLVAALDVSQPMSHLDYDSGFLWMARTGDGALPDNLVGIINPATGDVQVTNIGEFSTRAISADENGVWLAQGNGWDPALMRVGRDLEVVFRFDLGFGAGIVDMAVVDGVAWLILDDSSITLINLDNGAVIDRARFGAPLVAIAAGGDHTNPTGGAIWIAYEQGTVGALGSDGKVILNSFVIPSQPCCILADESSETIWLVGSEGVIYFAGFDVDPIQSFVADGSQVHAAVDLGTSLWTLGDSLTWILLGQ